MTGLLTRPVFAISLNLLVILFGLLSLTQISLRHKPPEINSKINIVTDYPGANFEIIEQEVTKPIENTLAGIDGILQIRSTSTDSSSMITVDVAVKDSIKQIISQIRDKISSVSKELPENARKSEIYEGTTGDSETLMYVSLFDENKDRSELNDFAQKYLIDKINILKGVGNVKIYGGKPYFIAIELIPAKLIKHGVSYNDIYQRLRQEKITAFGGEIETSSGKQTVILKNNLIQAKDLEDIVLFSKKNVPVKLKDISTVRVDTKETNLEMQIDGKDVVVFDITAKPTANPLEVAATLKAFFVKLQEELPSTTHLNIDVDKTRAFSAGINEVKYAIWEAVAIVSFVVLLSLGSFRASFLPIITIPICLVGGFIWIWVFGFSINLFTLFAFVLAVGLVVDDAIVVIENFYRHLETGCSALEAGKKSLAEIKFAVIVMTLTLAAVYAPLAFGQGSAALKFREFAWTLAGCVLLSGFVALTLIPTLAVIFFDRVNLKQTWLQQKFNSIVNSYKNLVAALLAQPYKVLFLAALIFSISLIIWSKLAIQVEPAEDEDLLFGYAAADAEYPEELKKLWQNKLLKLIKKEVPEHEHILIGKYRNHHWWLLPLKPRKERKSSAQDIIKRLKPKLNAIPGPMLGVMLPGHTGDGDLNLKLNVLYKGDPSFVLESIAKLQTELMAVPGVANVTAIGNEMVTRTKFALRQEMAERLGLPMANLEQIVSGLLSGAKVMDFYNDGETYSVELKMPKELRNNFSSLGGILVSNINNEGIPLGNVVNISKESDVASIRHQNRSRSITLDIAINPKVSLTDVINNTKRLAYDNLPEGAVINFSGAADELKSQTNTILMLIIFALLFIYFILSALFESFIDPFIIMLTVPLCLIGAALGLNIIAGASNIYTQIGLITLIGLITKHGILIVDFANRQLASGLGLKEAILLAVTSRVRPILMTTFAMIAGVVPLLLSSGFGAQARLELGTVIIGGMITGTMLSLFVIPCAYYVTEKYLGNKSLRSSS